MYQPINKASRQGMQIIKSMGPMHTSASNEALPGPGSYDTLPSDFGSKKDKGFKMAAPICISPRVRAAVSNPALQKMSVPSIPSRFLTPVIDSSQIESITGITSNEYCKMSRLIDDPTKVGPGAYEPQGHAIRSSPKSVIAWHLGSLSQRSGFDKSLMVTPQTVGPGSYNPMKHVDKKPVSMTI